MGEFNPFSLTGKTILVTGASSGIGRAIAIACSKMGAVLIMTARNESRLQETLSLLEGSGHGYICADLINAEERQALLSQCPKLDGFVQCAGVGSRVLGKFVTATDVAHVMTPNFTAPVLLQGELLQAGKINKAASIVYVASRAAESPSIGNGVYSASKGAIISYARCLALELAPRKIRVNCICPAMVWTDLIIQDGVTKEMFEEAQQRYPLKRYGQPEDVANLAIYLLSGASSWMTGSCVDITGGANDL